MTPRLREPAPTGPSVRLAQLGWLPSGPRTFRSSLWRALRLWIVVGGLWAAGFTTWLRRAENASWTEALLLGAGPVVVYLVLLVGRYLAIGIRSITFSSQQLTLRRFLGRCTAVQIDEVEAVWHRPAGRAVPERFVLATDSGWRTVSEDGFSGRSWRSIRELFAALELTLPLCATLGVTREERDGRDVVVYQPRWGVLHRLFHLTIAACGLALLMASMLASPPDIVLALVGAVLLAIVLSIHAVSVRRIVLGDEDLWITTSIGRQRTVPYTAVTDLSPHGVQVRGARDVVVYGAWNAGVLSELIAERVDEDQLSGESQVQAGAGAVATVGSLPVLLVLSGLAWMGAVSSWVVLAGWFAALSIISVWFARLRRGRR